MSNSFSGFGRIIKFEHKALGEGKSVLAVTISVPTGQQKKEGEKYPPSNIFKVSIWHKRADALMEYIEKGMFVYFTGELDTPYNYIDESGAPQSQQQMSRPAQFRMVKLEKREGEEGADTPAATAKSTAPKASSAKLPVPEEGDIDLPF